jgi:hypothetical protein
MSTVDLRGKPRVSNLEKLDADRFRLTLDLGDHEINDVLAVWRENHVQMLFPPSRRVEDRWHRIVSWNDEFAEAARVEVEIAVAHHEGVAA